MPKAVDHDQRRRDIVDVYLRLVARHGVEGATTRAIADELGVATGALWHYFANTDALLTAAADQVVANTNTRIQAHTADRRGLAALRAAMTQILPVSKATRDEAAIITGFWGRSATRMTLAKQAADIGDWDRLARRSLQEAIADGELTTQTPIEVVLRLLRSITYGQQVAEVLRDPVDPPIDHLGLVDDCLTPWIPSQSH